MHKLEFVKENDTHKIYFEIQTDYLIPDLALIKTKENGTCSLEDFAVPSNHTVKK